MVVSFPRSVASTTASATTAAIAAAPAIPVAFAPSYSSSSSSKNSQNHTDSKSLNSFPSLSRSTPSAPLPARRLRLDRNFANPPTAVRMDAPASDHEPRITQTEFMVDMECEGCVNAVKAKLQTIKGVENVEVDLSNQVVRILGHCTVKTMTEALEQTGRKAHLICQGNPKDFLVSAAVTEFKGPDIFGIVRFRQMNMEFARVEANFSGLSPGKHGLSINEYGDLTRGAASTGKMYNPWKEETPKKPLGDLGKLDAGENGEAFFLETKQKLRVFDLIGRSVVVYETEDKSAPGLTAAVIARTAGAGENCTKLCACDGSTIWEASNKGLSDL